MFAKKYLRVCAIYFRGVCKFDLEGVQEFSFILFWVCVCFFYSGVCSVLGIGGCVTSLIFFEGECNFMLGVC